MTIHMIVFGNMYFNNIHVYKYQGTYTFVIIKTKNTTVFVF